MLVNRPYFLGISVFLLLLLKNLRELYKPRAVGKVEYVQKTSQLT